MYHAVVEKAFILVCVAAFWDYLIGDPWNFPHPVQFMGWIIQKLSQIILQQFNSKTARKIAGVFLGLILIIGTGFLTWLGLYLTQKINPLLATLLQIILLASCFAGRSLRRAAEDVLTPLSHGDIEQARAKLSLYVGRDTAQLSQPEILRAVLETIAENATDGVTAPLFYALLGIFIPTVGTVPFCMAYKAASTLDSMIGYLREPYRDLGWFSAQLEDRLTWLPCRLTVLTIALFSTRPCYILGVCRRDATQDPSPNSGWSECVYAATLGVQLGGVNSYQGEVRTKPLLGEAINPITPEIIYQALGLMRWCFLGWLIAVGGMIWMLTLS
ncbi:adenosylcobinamide-phosphate synthase CbiB [Spirulina subsalsa FACHB-351]|uniref:Cobalamin biosynthesis protein CobD n=1 Tax=Spirulina subsalsa FACHB-351 TaxID=234711 RepID=A0ABT3L1K9_9CYAN|nr:adenosylcobinamide-phosphate synthase CbiB [Spirulina subsalsa]MCW6035097.1 adenosylcobinamide-phosphate synthase CbiB [Spirulina subsalsa FACHB-351]